jgi:hypothetical protein
MTDVRIHLVLDIDLADYADKLWDSSLSELVDFSEVEVDHIETIAR